jgi:hypothetical protein
MSISTNKSQKDTPVGEGSKFPYVVIRWMAAVYGKKDVQFVSKSADWLKDKSIVVVDPAPFEAGLLTKRARMRLIDEVMLLSLESGHRMCIVFGKDDCHYCQPDGVDYTSKVTPSGGLRIDDVTAVRSPSKNH